MTALIEIKLNLNCLGDAIEEVNCLKVSNNEASLHCEMYRLAEDKFEELQKLYEKDESKKDYELFMSYVSNYQIKIIENNKKNLTYKMLYHYIAVDTKVIFE